MKKTMQAMAVAVLGMALAAPVWGHSNEEWVASEGFHPGGNTMHPDAKPFAADEVRLEVSSEGVTPFGRPIVRFRVSGSIARCDFGRHYNPPSGCGGRGSENYRCGSACFLDVTPRNSTFIVESGDLHPGISGFAGDEFYDYPVDQTTARLHLDTEYVFAVIRLTYENNPWRGYYDVIRHVHFRTPSGWGGPRTPGPRSPPEPEPETPTPPEPESPSPPEPETPPDPEEPDPEEPDHTHPVERCDHIAIVPAMPRALSGDEGSPDHWLHVANPGAAGITFTITGRDMAGTKAGTYRRELPANRSVRVNMRDVEPAFGVEPEGWWRLVVTGSGPLEVVATMRQGAERRFVPVRTPATCARGR